MNDAEFGSIKLLRLKYRRRDQIIQTFCKIGPPQKLDPPYAYLKTLTEVLLNHRKCLKSKCLKWLKSNESRRIWVHGTFKIEIQKWGGEGGDKITQTFCKIGSPQKLDPPSLICTNLKTLREVHLNHTKCIEI